MTQTYTVNDVERDVREIVEIAVRKEREAIAALLETIPTGHQDIHRYDAIKSFARRTAAEIRGRG